MNIRKSSLGMFVMSLVLVCSAQAGIFVAWQATGGFVPDAADVNVGILTQPQNPSGQGLAQLIFSSGSEASPALFGGAANLVSGDNQVLASWVLQDGVDGTKNEFAESDPRPYSAPVFTPGAVFVRIFERNLPDIEFGTRYYDSPLLPLVSIDTTLDPPPAPQLLEANRNTLAGGFGDELNMSVALIPEPSTIGLMALGGIAACLRRRRVLA